MEVAAGRRIERRRQFAADRTKFDLDAIVEPQPRDAVEKRARVRMARPREHVARIAEFDEPVDSMAADIYSGITSGATDVADVTSGAHEGKAFVQDGMYGFTSVFGTTVVLAMSDNVDAMQTTVDSMFAANPQL